MIKVLIIGLGSIGQRHANALLTLGITNIAALRTGKGQKSIDSGLHNKIKMFQSEEEAFAWSSSHIIISNPTSFHLDYIQKAIDRNIKIFVEKPIANNLKDVKLINEINAVNGVVGYNLRFHGLFIFIKNLIVNNTYGRVISAQLHVGQYLPNWHPYEDYRKAYYSRKNLGGGGLRTLSHEIDLMQYFFGKIKTIYAKVQTDSDLEIDVDDVTNIIASADKCAQTTLHINLLDPKVKREGRIYFSEGLLEYDFVESRVTFTSNSGQKTTIYSQIENIDVQYNNQMQEFIWGKSILACSFDQGLAVMEIIEKCIESNNEKREICLV